jgi:FlaA1/EpsC-like NDP-sugar epimerase
VGITGSCGAVGRELLRQIVCEYGALNVTAIDNNESELFYQANTYQDVAGFRFALADIRDYDALKECFRGLDIVFHAAAYKHVMLCEQSPREAVQTNINGVQNVIAAASTCAVEKVLFTSSDKSVNPTNVMGASKLMGERLITAANTDKVNTIFASTRFGNVLGSRGSVVPVFAGQIKNGGPVTLTDPRMTRFVMTIQQAARLVITSCVMCKGGEVFVPKMPVLSVKDLAEVMVECLAPLAGHKPSDVEIVTTGIIPGEKLYEELINQEEIRRTVELEEYFVVLPALTDVYRMVEFEYQGEHPHGTNATYTSDKETFLDRNEIKTLLMNAGVLGELRPDP